MNIKIMEPLSDHLIAGTYPFGSYTYERTNDQSDYDFLNLVKFDCGEVVLQYKNSLVDMLYTGTDNFFYDLERGASQVNFEVLHTENFQQDFNIDPLKYYTDTMAKAYVGFARRDLKYPDRVFHINRCIYIAEKIIKKELLNLKEIGKMEIENDMVKLRNKVMDLRRKLRNVNKTL